jgi:hypothetical protein
LDLDRKYQSANVIQSKVDNCLLVGCCGDGIHIFGGADSSCIINNVTTKALKGWSFVDFSRIGNNFIACNSNDLNAYLRPAQLTLPQLSDDSYIKKIINAWYDNIVDDNLNIIDPVKYAEKVLIVKDIRPFSLTFGNGIFMDCYAEGGKSFISPSNIVIGSANLGNLGTPAKLDTYENRVARFENGVVAFGTQHLDDKRKVKEDFTVTTLGGGNRGIATTQSIGSAHLSLEFDFATTTPFPQSDGSTKLVPHIQNPYFPGLGYRLYYQNTFLEKAWYNKLAVSAENKLVATGEKLTAAEVTKKSKELENIAGHFRGWWEFVNFQGGRDNYTNCPIRLSNNQTDVGTGQIWFENGFYIGTFQEPQQNRRIKITTGIKTPTDDKKFIKIVKPKIGDRVLNTDPDPTDTNPNLLENKSYAGWIYTKVGWKPYGKIEM